MSSAPTSDEIARDATWLAQALDPAAGQARLVAMDRETYRLSSFLDDRMLQQPVDAQIVAWPEVEAAMAAELREDARWIFHIGHVGSTLVSRLVGELPGVLAVREPRLLRDLALMPQEVRERYTQPVPKLMSRTFAAEEVACVKATSFASEIAPRLVPSGGRALFVYATPANYIASILAGPNSVQELRLLAVSRAQRLEHRATALGSARGDADLAAIAWACEMSALEASADSMTDRQIEWADFDSMLASMPEALAKISALFGFEAEPKQLETIARGPLMKRYSKDLSYEYSPGLRQELIAEAAGAHSADIDAALAMLGRAAEKSPLLARALDRAGGD
jgi:hypothetical protein